MATIEPRKDGSGRPAVWRAFELVDPRDDLPRFVGAGKGEWPWRELWESRDVLPDPLGSWLRELDENDLQPVEDRTWLPSVAMWWQAAQILASSRIQQIERWTGRRPEWLFCGPRRPPDEGGTYRRGILAVRSDGRVEAYTSLYGAARGTGIDRQTIRRRIGDGREYRGYRFCDDCEGLPARPAQPSRPS